MNSLVQRLLKSSSCWCDLKALLKIYIDKNLGMKFYACPKYNTIINLSYFYFTFECMHKVLIFDILEFYFGRSKMQILHMDIYTTIGGRKNSNKR